MPDQLSDEELNNIDLPILALMAENSTMHISKQAVEKGKNTVKDIKIENCQMQHTPSMASTLKLND